MKTYLFLFVLTTITKLYSQVFSLYSTSSINDIYSASSFSPIKIRIAQNGVILLDTENSILVHFSENDTISYGGKSAKFSGLIDPIDITVKGLNVYVLNQASNSILVFDSRLNHIQTILISSEVELYPSLIAIDQYENIYIYSSDLNMIYVNDSQQKNFTEFIDLNMQNFDFNCISSMRFSTNGYLLLLSGCDSTISIFNQYGRLIDTQPNTIDGMAISVKRNGAYFIANKKGLIKYGKDQPKNLLIESNLIDIDYHDKKFIVLTDSLLLRYDFFD